MLKETHCYLCRILIKHSLYTLQFWNKFLPKELLLPMTLDQENENICRQF